MLAKRLTCIFCAALYFTLCSAVYANEPVKVLLDGATLHFDAEPQIINDRVMVPMRTIFEALGARVNWDENNQSITSDCDNTSVYLKIDDTTMLVNGNAINMDTAPLIVDDKTLVPVRAVSEVFGNNVSWDPKDHVVVITSPAESNPILDDVIINNDFRYSNFDGEYNELRIFDNGMEYFGMEFKFITKRSGEEYADILNGMANDLPDVRVFCGVVPTASEFYASDTYKSNYKAGIAHIYNRLSSKIIPLNIEGAMNINLGNYLYFKTDHHWTQFGAYCAYLDFCEKADIEPVSIDRFKTRIVDDFFGSWGDYVGGADADAYNMLNSSHDKIVVYEPIVKYTGMTYYDMRFEQPIREIKLISDVDNYYMFTEGDNPLDHFHTNVNNGRSICLIKESYSNPLVTWLANNYEDIYVADYRMFNGYYGYKSPFKIKEFYDLHPFDDLLLIHYPDTIISDNSRRMLRRMWTN